MNLPNKLTIFRMILTPVFLVTLVIEFPFHLAVSLLIFIVASITDLLDGKIARSQGIVTNFGKFLDPIADKVLTTSAFIGFIWLSKTGDWHFGKGMVWILFIIVVREFIVASIRMLAAENGKVVAADLFGKAKTVIQMVAVIMVLAFEQFIALWPTMPFVLNASLVLLYNIVLWASALATVVSGVNYMYKNREFINTKK